MNLKCASRLFQFANVTSDISFFVDIILNFLTGFVPKRSSEPVYSLRRIATNYLQDTFLLDAAATFPWEQVRPCSVCLRAAQVHRCRVLHTLANSDAKGRSPCRRLDGM